MITQIKNFIIFLINDIKNFFYQKLKYNKSYLYIANLKDLEKHKNNFYEEMIKNRDNKKTTNSFSIELDKLTFDNSINLNDPINPLVLTVNELNSNPNIELKNSSIYKFFKNHKPKNLTELFFLDKNKSKTKLGSRLDKLSQFTLFYPWLHKYPQ